MESESQDDFEKYVEQIDFATGLKKKELEEFVYPKYRYYSEYLPEGYKLDEEGKIIDEDRLKEELRLILGFIIFETIIRAGVKQVMETAIESEEIVKELKPFHRDLRGVLERILKESVGCTAGMMKVLMEEKKSFQGLLEEVTATIREHNKDWSKQQKEDDDQEAPQTLEEIQEKLVRQQQGVVTVLADKREGVYEAIEPYIKPEQKEELMKLFSTGSCSEYINFNGSSKMLGDFFRKLRKAEVLVGANFYTNLAEWLSKNFYFYNKDKGKFAPVRYRTVLKVMQEEPDYKKGIQYNN